MKIDFELTSEDTNKSPPRHLGGEEADEIEFIGVLTSLVSRPKSEGKKRFRNSNPIIHELVSLLVLVSYSFVDPEGLCSAYHLIEFFLFCPADCSSRESSVRNFEKCRSAWPKEKLSMRLLQ